MSADAVTSAILCEKTPEERIYCLKAKLDREKAKGVLRPFGLVPIICDHCGFSGTVRVPWEDSEIWQNQGGGGMGKSG